MLREFETCILHCQTSVSCDFGFVVCQPATKARKGINPFTKEPCVFKAKPARKIVKAFAVKALKNL